MQRLTLEEIELITGGCIPPHSGGLPKTPDNDSAMDEFVRCVRKLGDEIRIGLIS